MRTSRRSSSVSSFTDTITLLFNTPVVGSAGSPSFDNIRMKKVPLQDTSNICPPHRSFESMSSSVSSIFVDSIGISASTTLPPAARNGQGKFVIPEITTAESKASASYPPKPHVPHYFAPAATNKF